MRNNVSGPDGRPTLPFFGRNSDKISCNNEVIWERVEKNKSLPQIKPLKQKVRNLIAPNKNLGHIDN